MMHFFRKKLAIFSTVFAALFMTSCDEETIKTVEEIIDIFASMLGYDPKGENWEDKDDLLDGDDVTKASVSWANYCPPVGNQGQYGTCVAWATSYGLKTTLNMKDGIWDPSNKNSTSYQCSPVDLWHTMRSNYSSEVSSGCDGSSFDPAFQAMQSKGVETMASVPFKNSKMTCDGVSGKGKSNNKIETYRTVAYSADISNTGSDYGLTVENIKAHLQEGPLVIGAKLGENFMSWDSESVLKNDTKDYQGQHAYHAMMLIGFDDSKQAFRIQNSWGAADWGDNGYIWVDYNFFVKQFCFGVWSASNSSTASSKAAPKPKTGNDISVNVKSDKELATGERMVEYTITNNGNSTISTQDYPIIYLLFKARDLSEKHIVMENKEDVTLQPGESVTLKANYQIPGNAKAGDYYMALIADPYDEIGDDSSLNNFSFLTGKDLATFYVTGGKLFNNSNGKEIVNTIVNDEHANAYRNNELTRSLIRMKNKNK